jgi:hypothetical protein
MAIGSRVPGSSVIAGQYGIISAEGQPVALSQTVRLIDPAAQLVTLSQSVQQIDRARQLVMLQQRVLGAGVAPSEVTPPAAYVTINGVDVTSMTARDTVRITFNEDQAATAGIFLFVEMGAAVNIPSFHGKSIRIETHSDPSDIESEIIPLFTGWIETARHDRARGGIDIRATDLRDERLGREDGQQLKAITGGLYSTVTQREDVSGREYVTELMKTVSGSLGYTRAGDLRYHSWGVTGKPVDLTLTDADVAYDDLTTEFQTRSSVVNSVTVNMRYRWSALRSIYTEVDAYKPRRYDPNTKASLPILVGDSDFDYQDPTSTASGDSYVLKKGIDYLAFRRSHLVERVNSLGDFETLYSKFYPLEVIGRAAGSRFVAVIDTLAPFKDLWCQGFRAKAVRNIAQPVTEEYSFTITAPQSVSAYGEEIEGSELSFAAEVEYNRNDWESDFIYGNSSDLSEDQSFESFIDRLKSSEEDSNDPIERRVASERAKADSRRADLADAFNAAYRIAKKEIIASHRNNYVEAKLHRIQPVEIGDIVQHDNRIVQTTGQCVGVEYTIADGQRQTSVRAAISYMDTAVPAPVENWAVPIAPTSPEADTTLQTVVSYNTDDKAFDIKLPDISEQITDEYAPTIAPLSFDLPLEINSITLINGY